jgi:FdhD protein
LNNNFIPFTVQVLKGGSSNPSPMDLVREEPLSIRIQGRPYAVVMRTPGRETAHVAGFCLAEGVVDSLEDIETIASCEGDATNVVTLTVTAGRAAAIPHILERRGFVSQSSCGICGKELARDLAQMAPVMADGPPVDPAAAYGLLDGLKSRQALYRRTRASHAAAVYSPALDLLSLAEDVGRHNALDKAVGEVFLKGRLREAGVLILSSRISYEMVQKAARARIPFVMAASRPTSLAVELADSLNMTLASPARESGINVYCRPGRLVRPSG